jgi:YHS domain-containing protein
MKTLLFTLPLIALLLLGAFTAAHAAPSTPYPLTTCVVTGEKLGEMGPPVVINYKGTEVRFCCNSCPKKFYKNPEQYLAKLKNPASTQPTTGMGMGMGMGMGGGCCH